MDYQLVVIGGGPAGLAAAISAHENGLTNILIIERDKELGGILNQCIHNGFGLHRFSEELTGPEYAQKYIEMLADTGIDVCLDTMVLEITEQKQLHVVSKELGYRVITAKTIVLAMGCRERTRGAIAIPGTRPAGVLTAGAAQRYINMEGRKVGEKVLILGSGDIGLIMARRLTLEGSRVLACVELMPYSGGLNRNIVQCLHDYDIPLYLSHTITDIKGDKRVSSVTVARVDENRRPIAGSEIEFDCDTILLSVGLIPENELTKSANIQIDPRTSGAIVYENMETSQEGIFASGNVVHVHDLVDFVSAESARAGKSAADYVKNGATANTSICINATNGISYTVPQKLRVNNIEKSAEIFMRVNRVAQNTPINVICDNNIIASFKRAHLAPGEMERIVLPKAILNKINATEITVVLGEEASV